MSDWRRSVRIIAICWRASVSTTLEYRVNVLTGLVVSLFWLGWASAGLTVYFQFAGSLAGWTYAELLVVVGLFFTVNGVRQAFLEPNLDRMTEYVRRGTLDFLLTRPIDAQLLVSLRHLDVVALIDPVLGLAATVVGLVVAGHAPSAPDLAAFTLMFAVAVVLLYALTLALMALAVRLVDATELGAVTWSVVELSRFPVQLYRDPVQTVLTVVPVALLTTAPAQALLGRLDPRVLLIGPAVALACVAGASLLWRRALRGYTGASA